MQKRLLIVSMASAALILVGAGCEWRGSANVDGTGDVPKQPVACTMEAKQCPDGSYVGRTGPNCEFSPCPEGGANVNVRAY